MARQYVVDDKMNPKGYQQVSDLSSAKGITPPREARVAVIQAVGQDVRWRDDGTDPTADIGMVLQAGRDMLYTGNMAKIKFIEMTAGAEINVSYYD